MLDGELAVLVGGVLDATESNMIGGVGGEIELVSKRVRDVRVGELTGTERGDEGEVEG
jgi:hypothetical protein